MTALSENNLYFSSLKQMHFSYFSNYGDEDTKQLYIKKKPSSQEALVADIKGSHTISIFSNYQAVEAEMRVLPVAYWILYMRMGQAVLFTKSKRNHKTKFAIYKAAIQCNIAFKSIDFATY